MTDCHNRQQHHYNAHQRTINPFNLQHYSEKRLRLLSLEDVRSRFPNQPIRILEVGCGQGLLASYLCIPGITVFGLDLSQSMLKNAIAPPDRFTRILGSASAIPFQTGIFHLVFANALLHHVENPAIVLAEMIRVSCPGGGIVLIEPSRISL